MSLAKLGAGGAAYYLDTVALGAEEYYTGAGEAPGTWLGSASGELGLEGIVAAEDLRSVLAGVGPNGRPLAATNRRVPGFDLTFSAPKSVSLLHALGGSEAARAVVAAHETAVTAALGYLEREACFVRRGHNGVEQLGASGFVAAGFRHRTSRAGDPQLHTHVVVANLAHGDDGVWRTLDARHLYRQHRTAGFLYQAQLRAELTRSLGLQWRPARCGMAELAGVPEHVLRVFSRRRQQILEHLARCGHSGARASEVAALDTRTAKPSVPIPELRAEWRQRAARAGVNDQGWRRLLRHGHRQRRGLTASLTHPLIVPADLPVRMTDSDSTFARRDVIRAFAERSRAGADVVAVEAATDRFLAGGDLVRLGEDTFSTATHLQLEREVLATAAARRDERAAVAPAAVVDRALAGAPQLSEEQTAMVRQITTSGDGIEVVVGHPGSGKTTALATAAAAWTASGHHMVGAALAARAASELQTATGIPSFTLAALLGDIQRDPMPPHAVVVLDEAGMVGTRDLHTLLTHTQKSGTKVVLVGDPKQLPEITAGGAFRALVDTLEPAQLTENRRQRDPVERHALADLRAGNVTRALQGMAKHGRVTHNPGFEAATRQMITDWTTHRANGETVLLLAARRHHVAVLNTLAQQARFDAGELGPVSVTFGVLTVHVGDEVMALRNSYRHRILNGQRGTVTALDPEGMTVSTGDGAEVRLPRRLLEDGQIQLGYASTIHKSQGATVDRSLLLATDEVGYEAGYTALTRGRNENHLYLTDPVDHFEQAQQLRRSTAKYLAHDRSHRLER